MVEINSAISSVYAVSVERFSPSTSAKVRFSGRMPVSVSAFSAMGFLLSLEAF
jgi:hypothetical protein